MTTLEPTEKISDIVPIFDEKWEEDSIKMKNDRNWLVDQACKRINEMCIKNMKKSYQENGILPDEIKFKWFNVRSDLMNFIGVIEDEVYKKDKVPLNYSYDTIFYGGFLNKKSNKVNRQRMRDAGVTNPFVLDVKKKIASECVKVWDVSNKDKSKLNVWEITIFIHEIRKLNDNKNNLKEHIK